MSNFSIEKALSSESYAQKCWENYYYGGNTMNIDNVSINQINDNYKGVLQKWKIEASEDQNSYEITDDNSFQENTRKASNESIGNAVMSAGGVIATEVTQHIVTSNAKTVAYELAEQAAKGIVGKTYQKAGSMLADAATTEAAKFQALNVTNYGIEAAGSSFASTGHISRSINSAAEKFYAENSGDMSQHIFDIHKETQNPSSVVEDGKVWEYRQDARNSMHKAGADAARDKGKSVGAIVGCLTAFATGTKYTIQKPNSEEHEELENLKVKMEENKTNLTNTQTDLGDMNNNLETTVAEVEETNADANSEIEETNEEIETKKERMQTLSEKAETEEGLTESEKAELDNLKIEIGNLNTNIADTTNAAEDEISTINEDIKSQNETLLTESQESTNVVQEMTSYAESFDKATRTMAIVEAASQGLNVASGTKSSVQAFKLAASGSWAFGATSWAYALGAVGAAGAAMSAKGVVDQAKYIKDINGEIDVRESLQSLNTETQEMQEIETENLDEQISNIEELEIDTPSETQTSLPEEVDTTDVDIENDEDDEDNEGKEDKNEEK